MRRIVMKSIEDIFRDTYSGAIPKVCKSNEHIFGEIKKFSENNSYTNLSFSEQIYLYRHRLSQVPTCECGNSVKYLTILKGYNKFCSTSCRYARESAKENTKKTKLERYGNENYSASKKRMGWFSKKSETEQQQINTKRANTNIIRYGESTNLWTTDGREKTKKTNIKKYGADHLMKSDAIKKARNEANMSKYGVANPFQREDVKQKIKATLREKYGVDHPSRSDTIKQKTKLTCIQRYGVTTNLQAPAAKQNARSSLLEKFGSNSYFATAEFQNYIKMHNLEKYGSEYIIGTDYFTEKSKESRLKRCYENLFTHHVIPNFDIEEYSGKYMSDKEYSWYCTKCNNRFFKKFSSVDIFIDCPVCDKSDKLTGTSMGQREIEDFVRSSGIYFESNKHGLFDDGRHVDIYIPSLKLAIEYNGTYWHSDKYKSNNYHSRKYLDLKEKGIRLIQIWDYQWDTDKEKVKTFLLHKFGMSLKLNARSCSIKEITSREYRNFCNATHLKGHAAATFKYGLYKGEELVSIMSFSKSRFGIGNNQGYELVRFSSKCNVRGAASKLLSHFIKTEKPDEIYSYSSNDYSDGKLYESLGFSKIGESYNNYWYYDGINKKSIHRLNFTKKRLITLGYDERKTEKEITEELSLIRYFDSGTTTWGLKLNGIDN